MEIKTLRCEICGKIYHSDEVETEMIIAVKEKDEKSKSYECICPKCTREIYEFFVHPELLQNLRDKEYEEAKCRCKLEDCMSRIKSSVIRFYPFLRGSMDCEYYDIQTDNIIEKITSFKKLFDDTVKSRNIWKIWSIVFGIVILCLTALIVVS